MCDLYVNIESKIRGHLCKRSGVYVSIVVFRLLALTEQATLMHKGAQSMIQELH